MALEQRIETLRKKHTDIDARIMEEQARPYPDDLLIHRMKSEKLHLKDEMSRLMSGERRAA